MRRYRFASIQRLLRGKVANVGAIFHTSNDARDWSVVLRCERSGGDATLHWADTSPSRTTQEIVEMEYGRDEELGLAAEDKG